MDRDIEQTVDSMAQRIDVSGAGLNPCSKCKQRGPYQVTMTQDSWVAECRRCRTAVDIGNPPVKGYADDPDMWGHPLMTDALALTVPIAPPAGLPEPIAEQISNYFAEAVTLAELVERLNLLRRYLGDLSPFKDEPVDLVEWVDADLINANDYNPNHVAPPEMDLLRLSIMADGYTQPVVTTVEDGRREVVDGFHRHRVGRECDDVAQRVMGYLPVVRIRPSREDRGDRIAATIRHNRARGKHQVIAMSDIVLELKRRNWSDDKIGRQLGMDPDEVLRLTQITGLAEAFKDHEFSEAWEAVLDVDDEDLSTLEQIDG